MPLRTSDVFRNNIVTVPELQSDGYGSNAIYFSTSLVSTSTSKIITVNLSSGNDTSLLYSGDVQVQSGDILYFYGTGTADGYYTVNSVLTDTTLSVNESVNNSSGGNVVFMYPAGAVSVGYGLNLYQSVHITHNNVQGALQDLDQAISNSSSTGTAGGDLSGSYPDPTVAKLQGNAVQSGILASNQDGYVLTWVNQDNQWEPKPSTGTSPSGLTASEHEQLRQLIHLADGVGGPFEGFLSGAYRSVTRSPNLLTPTYICWWASSAEELKIVDQTITYNNMLQPLTITWNVYTSQGSVMATVTDTINYNVIFETSRTRTITDYTGSSDTTVITEESHEVLRQLIHLADGVGGPFEGFTSGAYRETDYPIHSPFESLETWYVDNTKAYKIISRNISRNSINMPVTITWQVYNVDGVTVLATVTDSIIYSNNIFEISRTRIISS